MSRHAAVLLTTILAALGLLATGCGSNEGATPGSSTTASSSGNGGDGLVDDFRCELSNTPEPELLVIGEVVEHADLGNGHIPCDKGYEVAPPTSGDHFDALQNCGFYTVPIRDYTAVHALEHGVVWVAYQPDLGADALAAIEAWVDGEPHALAAPYPGLKNPIVLSAWTRQMAVDDWSDPAVEAFLGDFLGRLSLTAPEAGATCESPLGVSPDRPDENYDAIFAQVNDE